MAVLEGGYHPNALRRIVPQVIGQMVGELPQTCETRPILEKKVQKKESLLIIQNNLFCVLVDSN